MQPRVEKFTYLWHTFYHVVEIEKALHQLYFILISVLRFSKQ